MNTLALAWDARIDRLIVRLPLRMQRGVRWLHEPSRLWVRLIVGFLLVLGGIFSILPILGLWMLPLGLALIAEDFPWMKAYLERTARWIESWWARRFGKDRGLEDRGAKGPGEPNGPQ